MKKISNKGLSLVELIVAIAIFAIAGIAICSFVSFSSQSFASSNKNVKLQYEQQIVVNRIRDIIMETSRGIYFDDTSHKLLVLSENPSYVAPPAPGTADSRSDKEKAQNIISMVWLDTTTDPSKPALMLGEKYLTSIAAGTKLNTITFDTSEMEKLSDTVFDDPTDSDYDKKKFYVDISEVEKKHKVKMQITFKSGDKEITVNPEISLRNLISIVDGEDDISKVYETEIIDEYSHIASVTISRDGKVFSQSKTDTVAMAGTSTSAKYDATVTKKKSYSGTINTDVTWKIDPSSLTEAYKNSGNEGAPDYRSAITLSSSGLLTLKEITVGGVDYKPEEFVSGGYLVIEAISKEDTNKSARLRIKITSGGIYPVSLSTEVEETFDYTNGEIVYILSHTITYTEGPDVTGPDAYDRVRYVSCVDENGENPPKGAGFRTIENEKTNKIDGKFIATKSMEGKTYKVKIAVIAKDKDGNEIVNDIEITVGQVPDKKIVTYPKLSVSTNHNRGDINIALATWSNGLPTYYKQNSAGEYVEDGEYAFYKYEFEIVKGEIGEWSSATKAKDFARNLYFVDGVNEKDEPQKDVGNQYYSQLVNFTPSDPKVQTYLCKDNTKRSTYIYCDSDFFWQSTYTYTVKLRVKISKTKNGTYQYYMKPGTDSNDKYNCVTDNKDKAYADIVTVTVPKVVLNLTPAEGIGVALNDKDKTYSVYGTGKNISNGKRPNGNSSNNQYRKKVYRVYAPEYIGIKITQANHFGRIDSIATEIDKPTGKEPALLTYSKTSATASSLVPNKKLSNGFVSGITSKGFYIKDKTNAEGLFYYICMTPLDWDKDKSISTFPYKGIWTCRLSDKTGNSVNSKFSDTGEEFEEYIFTNKYEGE